MAVTYTNAVKIARMGADTAIILAGLQAWGSWGKIR